MLDPYLQVPVVRPTDIRNVPLQPELCRKLQYPDLFTMMCTTHMGFNYTYTRNCSSTVDASILDLNCYSFHDKIFKNVHEANDFCKNAFGKSEEYTGKLAFGHFPQSDPNLKLSGKTQIWTYLKKNSGFLQEIGEFLCSCQSSHNNTFIKLKDSSVCPKAKDSEIFDSKVCPSEFNIRTACALVVKRKN